MNEEQIHAENLRKNLPAMLASSIKQAAHLFHESDLQACQMLINQILRVDPYNDEALQIAGLLKLRTERGAEAVEYLEDARSIRPENPDHHNNLALAYSRVGKHDEAVDCAKTAVKMAPGRAVFWSNCGVQLRNKANSLSDKQRESCLKEAEEAFQKAIDLNPSATTFSNMASLQGEKRNMSEAINLFQKALDIDPNLHGVHVDLSSMYFLSNQWEKAWFHYEHRMEHYPQATRWAKIFPLNKRWDGKTSLENKTVMVFCEQGCGDAIHFARYISLLNAKKLMIYCHEPLKELMACFGETYVMGQKIPEYDVSIPIMSIPFLTGVTKVDGEYIKAEKADMPSYDSVFKIGICWSGNPQHPGDRFRSVSLEEFFALEMPGVKLFSLQKDYRPRKYHDSDQIIDFCKNGPKVIDLSSMLTNFSTTAKFVAAMDLIVTVDTAVLHLAGAMGKKTWALLPYSPDWRWGLEGKTTELYSSVELFRQPAKNDWKSVFEEVGGKIKETVIN